MIETPIVLFIFRRPDLTRQVFESIRAAQPKHLLIVADGPRNPSEADLCTLTRQVLDHLIGRVKCCAIMRCEYGTRSTFSERLELGV